MRNCEGCKNNVEDQKAQGMRLRDPVSGIFIEFHLCPECLEKDNNNQLNLIDVKLRLWNLIKKSKMGAFTTNEAF